MLRNVSASCLCVHAHIQVVTAMVSSTFINTHSHTVAHAICQCGVVARWALVDLLAGIYTSKYLSAVLYTCII